MKIVLEGRKSYEIAMEISSIRKGEESMSLEFVLGETGIALMALLAGGLTAAIIYGILEYVSGIL